jgi:hypothetical protein
MLTTPLRARHGVLLACLLAAGCVAEGGAPRSARPGAQLVSSSQAGVQWLGGEEAARRLAGRTIVYDAHFDRNSRTWGEVNYFGRPNEAWMVARRYGTEISRGIGRYRVEPAGICWDEVQDFRGVCWQVGTTPAGGLVIRDNGRYRYTVVSERIGDAEGLARRLGNAPRALVPLSQAERDYQRGVMSLAP